MLQRSSGVRSFTPQLFSRGRSVIRSPGRVLCERAYVPDTMRCLFRKTPVAFRAEYQCDEVISSFETPLRVRPQGCASDYHVVRPCFTVITLRGVHVCHILT